MNKHHPERQTDTPGLGAPSAFLLSRLPRESFLIGGFLSENLHPLSGSLGPFSSMTPRPFLSTCFSFPLLPSVSPAPHDPTNATLGPTFIPLPCFAHAVVPARMTTLPYGPKDPAHSQKPYLFHNTFPGYLGLTFL